MNFSLQHYRFHLEPKAPLHMPAHNKGNVIRGGFGSTFRRIVCHQNCRIPETCDLRFVCPYTAIFSPFVPEGSEKISRTRDIPRPFVIKPPLETKETYLPGERLSFDLVLVGKTKDYLPYFIVTFKELSQIGLGWGRAPLDLAAVKHLGIDGVEMPVFSGASNLVQPPKQVLSWTELSRTTGLNNGKSNVKRITLRFLTPTMLVANGAPVRRPTFGSIAKRLRDRINALAYFYCGEGLDIDFKAFGDDADRIVTVIDSTRWVESARYSRRREVTHDLSGFIGEVTFEGEIGKFLPYLKLGEYLHVGKNAVFGNGWYRIEKAD